MVMLFTKEALKLDTQDACETLQVDIASGSGGTAVYVELLGVVIWNGSRDRDRHKVRVRIKSGQTENESSAVAERWDGSQWQEVWRLSPLGISVPPKLALRGPVERSSFMLDRAVLLNRVVAVLQ